MQWANPFCLAHSKTGQGAPRSLTWAANFRLASWLVPGPQLEHFPSRRSLQTPQSIPQAPVAMGVSSRETGVFYFKISTATPEA